jgi:hypothetical protein
MSEDTTTTADASSAAADVPGIDRDGWLDQPTVVRIGADGPLALLLGRRDGHPVVADLVGVRTVQTTVTTGEGDDATEEHAVRIP